jgi:2-polyprenyl-3-methyl-5-hydroxy-6-metoxy-1,4-benzoquinol methylase
MQKDLTQATEHFGFGKNWASYSALITGDQIEQAEKGVTALLGAKVEGSTFLDIGCGSGLHSLAALRLGAKEVVAIDLDSDSVQTTRHVLEKHAPGLPYRVEQLSVFDLNPASFGQFDIVYSWGVLHHTGDLLRAIQKASSVVRGNGYLAIALYRRVWLDWFWWLEKSWYAHASLPAQARARSAYVIFYKIALICTCRNPSSFIESYKNKRGMDFMHDVHDWMGGWPYEAIGRSEVEPFLAKLSFCLRKFNGSRGKLFGRDLGIFGSGCDEYLFQRIEAQSTLNL